MLYICVLCGLVGDQVVSELLSTMQRKIRCFSCCCSASVLDRLNGLLEPNGELSINERGIVNDEIPVVKPHPNFR